jgi:hydrogenase maturation protease
VTETCGPATGAVVLVVGIGNDLRGDDGAGRAVTEAIQRLDPPGVRVQWTHQLVPELAEQLASVDRVIFVDAALDPAPAPRVRLSRRAAGAPAIGGHHGTPEALLGLVRLAGLPAPEAFVVTVPAYDLTLTTRLSPATLTAVDTAVALVLRLCVMGPGLSSRRVAGASGPA